MLGLFLAKSSRKFIVFILYSSAALGGVLGTGLDSKRRPKMAELHVVCSNTSLMNTRVL